ncbi:hypothetical protein Mapa_010975 [Marchantia paleacea]|nr:hypothetical protein Mapa_010975 [Marchantia paleacea]
MYRAPNRTTKNFMFVKSAFEHCRLIRFRITYIQRALHHSNNQSLTFFALNIRSEYPSCKAAGKLHRRFSARHDARYINSKVFILFECLLHCSFYIVSFDL